MTLLVAPARARVLPTFGPESVSWRTLAPGKVEVSVDLSNEAARPTTPDRLRVAAAPLGAFLPSRSVAEISVTALAPGERRQVSTVVPTERLGLGDMRRLHSLLAQSSWVGNVDVCFESAPQEAVEVHRALDLRLEPGRPGIVHFGIPSSRRSHSFTVETAVSDPDWETELTLAGLHSFLLVQPPAAPDRRARVTVLVRRQPDGKEVPVEFGFETRSERPLSWWRRLR